MQRARFDLHELWLQEGRQRLERLPKQLERRSPSRAEAGGRPTVGALQGAPADAEPAQQAQQQRNLEAQLQQQLTKVRGEDGRACPRARPFSVRAACPWAPAYVLWHLCAQGALAAGSLGQAVRADTHTGVLVASSRGQALHPGPESLERAACMQLAPPRCGLRKITPTGCSR